MGLLIGLAAVWPAQGQEYIAGPAVGLDDAKSVLANPSLIAFHRSKVALGAKAHHLGLGDESGVPLRQGFLTMSTPFLFRDWVGLGTSIQYFDSPVYRRSTWGVSVSGRPLRFLSVGARVSALHLGYNESEFVGVDPGDPVFEDGAGKTTLSSALGVFAKPIPELNLAAGVRNLNRPNLSLIGDDVRAHREWFGGVSYELGPVRARAEVATGQYGLKSLFAIEAYATDGSYVRLGSDAQLDAGQVEAQLHVSGPLSINYSYGLPFSELRTETSGSHLFTVVYEFGRTPDVPDPPSPPPLMLDASGPDVEPEFAPRLHLTTGEEYLQHYEKRIEREIDVPDEALQQLSQEDVGVMDSSFASERGRVPGEDVRPIPDDLPMADLLSSTYDTSLTQLGEELAADPSRSVAMKGRDTARVKAIGMRNRLLDRGGVRPEQVHVEEPTAEADSARDRTPVDPRTLEPSESLSILTPEHMTLHLLAPYLPDDGSWELNVESSAGRVVRSFTGVGALPPRLEWDWSDDEGQPLDQGVYRYRLTWTGPDGTQLTSNERKIYVRKVVRKITIEVTQDPSTLEAPADDMEFRFEND